MQPSRCDPMPPAPSSDAQPATRPFWPEFWILFIAAMLAKLALFIVDRGPSSPFAVFLSLHGYAHGFTLASIEVAEGLLEFTLIVGFGLAAADAVGLGAPILAALLRRRPILTRLKSAIFPTLLVGVLIGTLALVRTLPILHPNARAMEAQHFRIYRSAAGAKLRELELRTGLSSTFTQTALVLAIDAVPSEEFCRLFLLTCILWLLAKCPHRSPDRLSPAIFWIAILLEPVLQAIPDYATVHMVRKLYFDALGPLIRVRDPLWLAIGRELTLWLPSALLLNWLYVRRGLESCIVASAIGGVLGLFLARWVPLMFW